MKLERMSRKELTVEFVNLSRQGKKILSDNLFLDYLYITRGISGLKRESQNLFRLYYEIGERKEKVRNLLLRKGFDPDYLNSLDR